MVSIIVLLAIIIALFVLVFVSKRRFGVLALGLAAGSVLSSLWAERLIPIVQTFDVTIGTLSLAGMVSTLLVVAPAILLLFSGPSYHSVQGRAIGALIITILAAAFLIVPLGSILVLEGVSRDVFTFIAEYQVYIVTVGIGLALFDVAAVHTTGGGHKHKGKH